MEHKRILVVGLGLIGGSLALALQGFENYEIVGSVRSQATYHKAVMRAVAQRITFHPEDELPQADVVILCQDPAGIMDFLQSHRNRFKPGSMVLDVCGIKTAILDAASCLPEDVDFIGCHPMAGKEVSGIDNADSTLFRNTHFLVIPGPHSTQEHLALLERMAAHCQFGDVVRTTAQCHDQLIAYTSQLMHIIAVSVCDSDHLLQCAGFEGGSFRDCTRVAALDVPLWTQLFTLNAHALVPVVVQLEQRLHQYRLAIESGDRETLSAMLSVAAERKKQLNLERERGDDIHPQFQPLP